jgi:hypothetical protein
MKYFDITTTGRVTIAAGISALIGLIAMFSFFATGSVDIGVFADYMGALTTVLVIPLFLAIGRAVMAEHENLGFAIMILIALGILMRLIEIILMLSGIPTEQWIFLEYASAIILGIAVLSYGLMSRKISGLSTKYGWFTIIFGISMLMNIFGFVFEGEINRVVQGAISITEANPVLLLVMFVFSPVYLIGYPIWLLWTGRAFSKIRQQTMDLQTITQ